MGTSHQICWPPGLVDPISPCPNIILQLDLAIWELYNRLRCRYILSDRFRMPYFEELWIEQSFPAWAFAQLPEGRWSTHAVGLRVSPCRILMLGPYLLPHVLRILSDRVDEPAESARTSAIRLQTACLPSSVVIEREVNGI